MAYGPDGYQNLDPWIALVAEEHVSGSSVGETLQAILLDQFTRLRDGDAYFFEWDQGLSATLRDQIRGTTLADIIVRNTAINPGELQANIFVIPEPAAISMFAALAASLLRCRSRELLDKSRTWSMRRST